MSEILIKWLNQEICLSKQIKEISEDFKNGYLFAELLYKTKQIPNISQFKNTNNKKDIIRNFCLLTKPLLDMGIVLNEKDRNEIINSGIYASKIYLLKIRQVLDKKFINLEQLKYKYSNDLQSLYNKMMFKSQNEKYLYNLKIRLENEKNSILYGGKKNLQSLTEANNLKDENILDKKYSIGGPLYKQLKKKYSHLELTDFDLEIILLDMKDQEIKLNYFKEKIKKTEKNREKECIDKEKKEIKNWKVSILKIKQNNDKLLKESWEPVKRYQKASYNYYKNNAKKNEKITKSFENNLGFFVPEKNEEIEENEENEEDEENEKEKENKELKLKRSMELKNEIYMRNIKEKLENKIKSKKDKEKRERKRLKEEREMYERMNTEKNMFDMIKNMENNINKNVISVKGDELIAKTEQLIKSLSPIEQKRIKYMDELINKEIDKENRIDEEKNKLNVGKSQKINMNVTKLINLGKTKEIEKTENTENTENVENINETEIDQEKEKEEKNNDILNAEKSSYSKLTNNDYGLNLINDAFRIHSKDSNINDRIKLFKTRLMYTENSQNLPKLPEISISEEDENYKRQKSESNVLEKSINDKKNNEINIFDKESFYEEMNKLNYENFKKESNARKIKKEKKYKLIKPIINKLIDISDYISIYQENKGVQLLDNSKWDEIMDKFKNWEDIYDNEEDEIISQDEVSEYLFDYGYKLTENDNLIFFDYINYLNIFNDLIIPTSMRGKQYKYYELYDEVYNLLNNDVDIKEYEPNEDEIDNLILPKSPNFVNYKLYDIIEFVIKNKYNKNIKSNLINNNNDINNQKGKYFYLPIKISIVGYPMSGKNIQSSLINEKYPNIKFFNPEEIFESKLAEYKELSIPIEKSTKTKNMKPNQLEQFAKEREEKLEQFKPILNIIQPYYDYLEKKDHKNFLDLNESNYKEDILTDIYINLLIYELDKIYPDDKESKNKLIDDLNEKYKQYISIKEQIEEIKKNEEESKKENDDKGKKIKNTQNFAKDLENLNKQLESIIPSLYVGFIFINFPKNVKQAKKLENKITGYISEFEKPKDFIEEKLFSYNNILDINIKKNKHNSPQISMFDLFINFNITSEEVDNRYKNTKYDPGTKKVYNIQINPPSDKKVLEKLLPGKPNYDKDRIKNEKEMYDKNIYNLINFYKIMTNGNQKIYKNVDQMDTNYIQKININIENSMNQIIFEHYYKNIELVINDINKINIEENTSEKDNEDAKKEDNQKEEEKKVETEENKVETEENKVQENKAETDKKEENEKENITKEESKKEIEKKEENSEEIEKRENENLSKKDNENNKKRGSINIKEIKTSIYNFSEEISNQFEEFASNYGKTLINFIHFILRQKEHITLYLTQIQNDFITYLNRKTDKTNIAEIYVNKYNSLINDHPNLLNNPKVFNDLKEDIDDVGKSIWLNIQNKKNEDIKYLQNLKELGKVDNELNKFWEFVIIIIEAEVKKYLVTCEIIIKYYLNQTGLLGNILGIFENNLKINKLNEFMFKINHLKYLFKGIDIPENIIHLKNKSNEELNKQNEIINNDNKNKENGVIIEDENEGGENNDKNENCLNKKNEEEKTDINIKLNKTQKSNISSYKKDKTIEEKLDILFMNSLKIIVRQDLLMKPYKEKIKNFNPSNEKENKKVNINKLLNSSISSRSSNRKSKLNKISKNGFVLYIEELSNQIKMEKNKFKYRLMFLKYFIIKYYNIIIECFNNTYNAMDDWIIMSVRSQNNTLNEFVSYLKKILNKSNKKAFLEDFEFDNFDIYRRYKIDINLIFDKMNLNSIVNLKNKKEDKKNKDNKNKDKEKGKNENEIILINENDMPYIDKYIYNINDLMYIYNYLKAFGTEGCEYLVKYEIVQEILVHHYFSKKKYGDLSNINNLNNNSENDANSIEINNKESENNNSINFLKSSKSSINILNEENNGIPKIVLFLSNINYINCLNKFSEYENKYININNLFTCLILLGSELITSEKFLENINEQQLLLGDKNEKKERNNIMKHILLNKEEFLRINFWFENDKYLNNYYDSKEEELFKNDNNKIQKIKNSIFQINEEEGKIDLNKIVVLLHKFNGKEKEEKNNEETNINISNNNIDEENNTKSKNDETKNNEENKIEGKEEDIIQEKKEEKEKKNEGEGDEGDDVVKKEEDKKEEKENEENKEEKSESEEEEDNENKSDKESIKNDETSSNQNESEIIKNPVKNKKNRNKKDEVINNIFNALFIQ